MSLQPTLAEVIRTALDSRLSDVHTSLPGRIKSYDSATQTADIEIVIKRAETSSSGGIVHETYPVIPNVMVAWPRGGGYSFQFPLSAGDHVWLLFSEAATGQWRSTGDPSNPGDLERHGLSYPIAMPCIGPDADALPSVSRGTIIVPGSGRVEIKTDGGTPLAVALAPNVAEELAAIRTELNAIGTALNTAVPGSYSPTWTPGSVAATKLRTE